MRLVDLSPRWLEFEGRRVAIMFRCPHCVTAGRRDQWITCFFVPAGDLPAVVSDDQEINGERRERLLFEEAFRAMGHADPRGACWEVVSCRPDIAWSRTSDDFETMSVTPSIDGSASGHWHGYITNGQITG